MDYHVLEARYVGGHVVRLRFGDGTAGEIDLGPALRGLIFEALRDEAFFKRFAIHPEFHTLVWPNGADFDPAILHDWPDHEAGMIALAQRWAAEHGEKAR